jgi:hypothetical protein
MAYGQLKDPAYANPWAGSGRCVLPAAAKTVFNDVSNTAVLLAADADRRRQIGLIYVKPMITIVQGKLQLYYYDGTSYVCIDEVTHAAGTVSTTATPDKIVFSQFTKDTPLFLHEGHSLLLATTVAQTANSLVGVAGLIKAFGAV